MKDKRIILIAVVVLALAGWVVRVAFFPPDENQKIETVIRFAAAAFAEKNSKAVGDLLTKDFSVHHAADRDSTLDYLKMFFFKVKDLDVNVKYIKHEIDQLPALATEARVLVVAVVTGVVDGQKFQAFSGQGADTAILSMRKEADRWLVFSARALDTSEPEKAFEQLGR
ncbi:MAG TPA: hypothetical protein DCG57_04775 [Candidatus Riflebacteria bacterium]|jgi:hypothetical protein|nr:hypothetical protein [Candidatus Riflebacteria bacterium]